MTLEEWKDAVRGEEDRNLHYFNAEYEAGLTQVEEVRALWKRFEDFLCGEPVGRSAAECLDTFSRRRDSTIEYIQKPEATPAFNGPSVEIRGRTLSTQQTLRRVDDWLPQIYPRSMAALARLKRQIEDAPKGSPSDAGREEVWDEWLSDIRNAAEEARKMLTQRQAVSRPRLVKRPAHVTRAVKRGSTASEAQVMWFTFAEDLDRELSAYEAETPRQRARRAAERRLLSGVYHPTDLSTDLEQLGDDPGQVAFRVVLDLRVKWDDNDSPRLWQPTIFAQGSANLFVSEPPDPQNGGYACRLARRDCGHSHDGCRCYQKGLPEVVTSQHIASAAQAIRVEEVVLLSYEHLQVIKSPDVAELRSLKQKERGCV